MPKLAIVHVLSSTVSHSLCLSVSLSLSYLTSALNYSQLHELSVITEHAGFSKVPAFKISDNFSTSLSPASPSNLYTVRVRINSDHVLGVMVADSKFSAARYFAEVARVPVADVTLKQVRERWTNEKKS